MKKYRVGVVGIGAVGAEMVRVLRQRNFPASEIRILARSERDEIIDGETYHVVPASVEAFDGLDFAFFAGTEGAKGASQTYGWEAVKKGVVVIDNGDDFRMDNRVPLVIPEINAHALKNHQGLISNPNCSTIIALMALAPLHKAARIKRFIAVTYQAVSGTGKPAIVELEQQVHSWVEKKPLKNSAYPHQIAFNLIPKIGGGKPDVPGFTSEELKMLRETHKILEDASIKVSATCVRVPVFNAHSEALHVEFERHITPEEARDILSKAEGVTLVDDLAADKYPMPISVSGQDNVFAGRIRKDLVFENGLALFVAGDNIRKGAATNAIQIAECLISK
jgi:aspartate-semialdehyde dehydrogenase